MILLPLLAILGGAAGYFLRRWELASAFDQAGLSMAGAPATLWLIALSAALFVLFALLCLWGNPSPVEQGKAFAAKGNIPYLIFSGIAAALMLAAAITGLTEAGIGTMGVILWILCIISCLCIAASALRNFRAQESTYSLLLLVPACTACFWLVAFCQARASDPVLLAYVFPLFAVICSLLAFYFTASLSFSQAKAWPCALFSLLAIFFCMTTLADSHALSDRLLFLSVILYHLVHVTVLLRRAFPRRRYVPKHLEKK